MNYRDEDDPFEEDIVFDQAGLLSTTRKSSKSAIRRVSSGKCAMFSKTLGLCGAFLGLGLTCAIPGPLSPLPPEELRNDISLMSYEVMYRCQGFMIGAMFGARLLDRFNRLFLVFLALLVTALLVTIIPWCGIVWLLRTDMFLLGATLGFLSTGGNVLCLDLWGRNSGPFMQALHFSFSLGVFLAPFLSQPLMVPVSYAPVVPTTTPATHSHHRLPRDLGNLSHAPFADGGVPLLQSTAPTMHHDALMNKSWTSNPASMFPLSSTAISTKIEGHLSNHQAFLPPVSPPTLNSSLLHSTSAPLLKKISEEPLTLSLPSSHDVPTAPEIVASSPVNRKNISLASATPQPGPLHPSTQPSQASNSLPSNSATTTHRAPRPKPVMTNSEKLKDKNWENDKFRKPPPEDLVPLSTTMKPMARKKNETVTAVVANSTSTHLASPQVEKSTSLLNLIFNETDSANISKTSATSKQNYSSTTVSVSKSLPLVVTQSSSSSALKPSLSSTPVVNSKPQNSSELIVSLNDSSQTKFKALDHPVSKSSDIPVQNSSEIVPSERPTSKSPVTSAIPIRDGGLIQKLNSGEKVNKPGTMKLPATKLNPLVKEELPNHSSEELQLAVHEDPGKHKDSQNVEKNRNWQSGISLDEQDSPAQNFSRLTSPTPEVFSSLSQSEVTSRATQEPPVQLSIPSLKQYSGKPKPEESPAIHEKSLGGVTTGATTVAKPIPKFLNSHNMPSTKDWVQERPVLPSHHPSFIVENFLASTVSPTTPVLTKNSTQKLESSSHVMSPIPPISPKHTHHSKPASTVVNDTEVTHTVIDAFANRLEKYGLSKMQLMYLTVGSVLLATSFLFLGFLCFNPRDPKSKTDEEEMNGEVVRGTNRNKTGSGQSAPAPSRWLRHALILLMLLILLITSGVQAMYGQLLLVYAMQSPLQLSQSTGTALTATFLGALTSTRFACILLASALSPTAMLVLSVSICSCATWLLSALATSSEVALWIGSVMVGVGTASVFPSGLLWMQRHVLITHRVAAMLVMGPAMGEMIFPTLAYKMMVSMGPASLVHLPALLSLFAIALWAAEWRLARYPRQSLCSHGDDSSGYQLASQNDEDDLLDLTMSPIINGNNTVTRNGGRSYALGHGVHRMSA